MVSRKILQEAREAFLAADQKRREDREAFLQEQEEDPAGPLISFVTSLDKGRSLRDADVDARRIFFEKTEIYVIEDDYLQAQLTVRDYIDLSRDINREERKLEKDKKLIGETAYNSELKKVEDLRDKLADEFLKKMGKAPEDFPEIMAAREKDGMSGKKDDKSVENDIDLSLLVAEPSSTSVAEPSSTYVAPPSAYTKARIDQEARARDEANAKRQEQLKLERWKRDLPNDYTLQAQFDYKRLMDLTHEKERYTREKNKLLLDDVNKKIEVFQKNIIEREKRCFDATGKMLTDTQIFKDEYAKWARDWNKAHPSEKWGPYKPYKTYNEDFPELAARVKAELQADNTKVEPEKTKTGLTKAQLDRAKDYLTGKNNFNHNTLKSLGFDAKNPDSPEAQKWMEENLSFKEGANGAVKVSIKEDGKLGNQIKKEASARLAEVKVKVDTPRTQAAAPKMDALKPLEVSLPAGRSSAEMMLELRRQHEEQNRNETVRTVRVNGQKVAYNFADNRIMIQNANKVTGSPQLLGAIAKNETELAEEGRLVTQSSIDVMKRYTPDKVAGIQSAYDKTQAENEARHLAQLQEMRNRPQPTQSVVAPAQNVGDKLSQEVRSIWVNGHKTDYNFENGELHYLPGSTGVPVSEIARNELKRAKDGKGTEEVAGIMKKYLPEKDYTKFQKNYAEANPSKPEESKRKFLAFLNRER